MSDGITFEWSGVEELGRALLAIPAQLSKQVVKEALQAGGAVVKMAAEAQAPVRTGELQADIIVKVRVDPELINNYALIGPGYSRESLTVRGVTQNRRGKLELDVDTTESPGVYGAFVEKGHKEGHRSGGEIEYGGDAPPHPWLRPAFESSKSEAMTVVTEVLAAGLKGVVESVRSPVV
jgi:HK97 gp10 family phage protein